MTDLAARIAQLEAAVTSLAALTLQEFGDSPGHPFHGNQWSEATRNGDHGGAYRSLSKAAESLDFNHPIQRELRLHAHELGEESFRSNSDRVPSTLK